MKKYFLITSLIGVIALAGCAMPLDSGNGYQNYQTQDSYYQSQDSYSQSQDPYYQRANEQRGVVESVRHVTIDGGQTGTIGGFGIGTLGGAAIGGLAGSAIGEGRGSVAAAVGGAIVGGMIGHQLEQGSGSRTRSGLEITVRLDQGGRITVTQVADEQFHAGDRVRIWTNGNRARVMH